MGWRKLIFRFPSGKKGKAKGNRRLEEFKAGQAQPTVGKENEHSALPGSTQGPDRGLLNRVWQQPQSLRHLWGLGTEASFSFFSVPKTEGGDEARKKQPNRWLRTGGIQTRMLSGFLRNSSVEVQVQADELEPAKAGGGRQGQAKRNAKRLVLQPDRPSMWTGFLDV